MPMGEIFLRAISARKLIDYMLAIGLVLSAGLAICPNW
jgi:hypothetical protein